MTEKMMFEEAMQELETIVARLESGDVPLEQSMELYQRGMQLSLLCQKKLSEAEEKMNEMIQQDQPYVEEGDI